MFGPTTVIPAKVTVLAKRSVNAAGGVYRILTVSVGRHEWDLQVSASDFELAMGEMTEDAIALQVEAEAD